LALRNRFWLTKNYVALAGHGRLLAARRLGLTDVPVIVIEDLTEQQPCKLLK